jgi:hypothetical protein
MITSEEVKELQSKIANMLINMLIGNCIQQYALPP